VKNLKIGIHELFSGNLNIGSKQPGDSQEGVPTGKNPRAVFINKLDSANRSRHIDFQRAIVCRAGQPFKPSSFKKSSAKITTQLE
jgi:hypothetical protein